LSGAILMKVMIILIIIFSLVLTGCQAPGTVEKTQVIKCNNIIFKCSDKDCSNQCGKIMSDNNQKVITGLSVNSGKGCECKYVDYG
jgi:hypothetical protein